MPYLLGLFKGFRMSHYKNVCPKCSGVTQCRCMGNKVETKKLCNKCVDSLNEDAVAGSISAGAVAGARGLLFTGVREITQRRKKVAGVPVVKFKNPPVDLNFRTKGIAEGRTRFIQHLLGESGGVPDAEFDSADIVSKLVQNAKIAAEIDSDNLAVFGMEGDDGSITKVYIPKQQAKDFEIALGEVLKDNPEANQEEIAGILFDLKDRFKIVDVKWPTIQEDEEQAPPDATGATPAAANADPFGDTAPSTTVPPSDPNAPPVDPNAAPAPDSAVSGSGDSTSDTLAAILDMLRSDAEARKADAEAKTAEANAKEAEATAKITGIKMQGEEEVLDAEAYFKQKKEEKKEAERLKMLARFRQENKSDDDSDSAPTSTDNRPQEISGKSSSEEEEHVTSMRKSLLSLLQRI